MLVVLLASTTDRAVVIVKVENNRKHNSNSNSTGQSHSHRKRSRDSNSEEYVVAIQGTVGFNILFTLTVCKCVGPASALFANPAGSIWLAEGDGRLKSSISQDSSFKAWWYERMRVWNNSRSNQV